MILATSEVGDFQNIQQFYHLHFERTNDCSLEIVGAKCGRLVSLSIIQPVSYQCQQFLESLRLYYAPPTTFWNNYHVEVLNDYVVRKAHIFLIWHKASFGPGTCKPFVHITKTRSLVSTTFCRLTYQSSKTRGLKSSVN